MVRARYRQMTTRVGVSAGVQLGDRSDCEPGFTWGGDPHLFQSVTRDSRSCGARRRELRCCGGLIRRTVRSCLPAARYPKCACGTLLLRLTSSTMIRSSQSVDPTTQLAAAAGQFWSIGRLNRVFVFGGIGTSFDSAPLPSDEFSLGIPFRLGAYKAGELRGRHYFAATVGYLRRVGRLPDFLGGSIFAGGWLENGDAVNEWRDASGERTAAPAW